MYRFMSDLGIIALCYIVGIIFQHVFKSERNRSDIPWMLALIGGFLAALGAWCTPSDEGIEFLNIVAHGVIDGLAAVGIHVLLERQKKLVELIKGHKHE